MTNAEYKKNEQIVEKLTGKCLHKITPEDIVDFWGDYSGAIITKHYNTGEVTYSDAYDTETFESIEKAAEAAINTVLWWAVEGEEAAVDFLTENGISIEDGEADEPEKKTITKAEGKLIKAWEILTGGIISVDINDYKYVDIYEYGSKKPKKHFILTDEQRKDLFDILRFDIIAAAHNTRGQLNR